METNTEKLDDHMTKITAIIERSDADSSRVLEYAHSKAESLFSRVDAFVSELKLQLEEASTQIERYERDEMERKEKERREQEQSKAWFSENAKRPGSWFKGKKARESAIIRKQEQINELKDSITGAAAEMSEETEQLIKELRTELQVMQATNETNSNALRNARSSLYEVQTKVDDAMLAVSKERHQHKETSEMLQRRDSEILEQRAEILRFIRYHA